LLHSAGKEWSHRTGTAGENKGEYISRDRVVAYERRIRLQREWGRERGIVVLHGSAEKLGRRVLKRPPTGIRAIRDRYGAEKRR